MCVLFMCIKCPLKCIDTKILILFLAGKKKIMAFLILSTHANFSWKWDFFGWKHIFSIKKRTFEDFQRFLFLKLFIRHNKIYVTSKKQSEILCIIIQ